MTDTTPGPGPVLPPESAPEADLPGAGVDEEASDAESAVGQTRRSFLLKLAKASAFVPPTLVTLKGRPVAAQQSNVYQAWANYFQSLANFYAAQGAVAAANYYQFWANYLQALANQAAAQQGMLSPSNTPVLDPRLERSQDQQRTEPWHQNGPAAPPPWSAPPPGGGSSTIEP